MKSMADKLARLLRFLESRETFTHQELVAYTGMHRTTMERLVRKLREPGPNKMLRVCAYDFDGMGRPTVMVFERGTRADAKRPPPRTNAQRKKAQAVRAALRELGIATDAIATPGRPGAPSKAEADARNKRPRVGSA